MSLRRSVVAAATALSLSAVATAAHADAPAPVRVDYETHAGCPAEDAFTSALLTRVPNARITRGAAPVRTLVVRFRPSLQGNGLDGVLVVRDSEGLAGSERVVHAQSCEDIVAALAVIASVVVESDDEATAAGPAPARPAGPPSVVAGPATETRGTLEEPPSDPSEQRTPQPPAHGPWDVAFGAGVGVASGASPTLLASADAFVELSRSFGGIFEPAARLRFEITAIGGTDKEGGGARFTLTTGGSDLCPVAFRTSGLRAQPCIRGEGGELDAHGNGVEPARSEARPWFALGPIIRLRLELGGPFFAEIEGGALALFVRDRFFVEPNTLVYRPPPLAADASFGLGIAFR